MLVYLVVAPATGYMFLRLPTDFLPTDKAVQKSAD